MTKDNKTAFDAARGTLWMFEPEGLEGDVCRSTR